MCVKTQSQYGCYSLQQVQNGTYCWGRKHIVIVLVHHSLYSSAMMILQYGTKGQASVTPTPATTITLKMDEKKIHQNEIQCEQQQQQKKKQNWVVCLCVPHAWRYFQFLLYEKWLNFCLFAIILLFFAVINMYVAHTERKKNHFFYCLFVISIIITYEYARFNRNSFIILLVL